jgi:hypothetical protein
MGLETSIEELISISGYFKAIVAVPTGLAELLSLTDCNSVNIFPEEFAFNYESFQQWAPHAYSYLWKKDETDALIRQLVDQIMELQPVKDESP